MTGRLFKVVAIAALAFAISTTLLSAPTLILVLNGMLLSVSAGVMVAYAPVVVGALHAALPSKGDYLGAGIFFAWFAVWGNRVISFIGRDAGYPDIYNTNITSLFIGISLIGGLMHLWAPNAVEGRLPRERWVMTGAVVAAGLFVVFVAWTTHMRVAAHPPVLLQ